MGRKKKKNDEPQNTEPTTDDASTATATADDDTATDEPTTDDAAKLNYNEHLGGSGHRFGEAGSPAAPPVGQLESVNNGPPQQASEAGTITREEAQQIIKRLEEMATRQSSLEAQIQALQGQSQPGQPQPPQGQLAQPMPPTPQTPPQAPPHQPPGGALGGHSMTPPPNPRIPMQTNDPTIKSLADENAKLRAEIETIKAGQNRLSDEGFVRESTAQLRAMAQENGVEFPLTNDQIRDKLLEMKTDEGRRERLARLTDMASGIARDSNDFPGPKGDRPVKGVSREEEKARLQKQYPHATEDDIEEILSRAPDEDWATA